MRLTDQALDQARAVGATETIAEFKLASEKMAMARASFAAQDFKGARVDAEQAELDARLAEAQVLTQKSQEQINVATTRNDRLRKQLQEAK
jgi:hypothetical protein